MAEVTEVKRKVALITGVTGQVSSFTCIFNHWSDRQVSAFNHWSDRASKYLVPLLPVNHYR